MSRQAGGSRSEADGRASAEGLTATLGPRQRLRYRSLWRPYQLDVDLPIRIENLVREAHQVNLVQRRLAREKRAHFPHCNRCSSTHRVTVHAAADRRERYRTDAMLLGQSQRKPVAPRERIGLALRSPRPDRTNGMNYISRLQTEAGGHLRFPGSTSAQGSARRLQQRPCSAVDRAVYAASAQQGRVGSVDDRVHPVSNDVSLLDREPVAQAAPRRRRLMFHPATIAQSQGSGPAARSIYLFSLGDHR